MCEKELYKKTVERWTEIIKGLKKKVPYHTIMIKVGGCRFCDDAFKRIKIEIFGYHKKFENDDISCDICLINHDICFDENPEGIGLYDKFAEDHKIKYAKKILKALKKEYKRCLKKI